MTGSHPITVTDLSGLEVLDSRGRPTLSVTVQLAGGARGTAGVPSGASTGTREAVELRDHDPDRYAGLGVTAAVGHVDGELADAIVHRRFADLAAVDQALIAADGTSTKSRLGANAVVGVSMAIARAVAADRGQPLWQLLDPHSPRLPVPHFNVVNGGAHAANGLDFQEFMIAPVGASTFPEAVRAGAEIYTALKTILAGQGMSTGLGDEGGFAPDISQHQEVLTLLVRAIETAGYPAARDQVAIALDPAASEFHTDAGYHLAGATVSASQLIDQYQSLITDFPIWSIEDGLAEDDWAGWTELTQRLGDHIQLVGDDIFVTNATTIREAAARPSATRH